MGDATTAAIPTAPIAAPLPSPSGGAPRAKAAAYTPDGPLDPTARERFEGTPTAVPPERARSSWIAPAIGLAALLAVGAIAWYAVAGRNRGSASLSSGITAYREGRREAAAGDFMKAAKDDPNDPMPHVYLARMAREAGNMTTASAEAVTAVRLGPNNGVALRELASVSFAQQNYDAARRFYIRAVQADSSDKLSQGFLGCSLVRLGRVDEGMRWITRAGPGAWSSCAPQPGASRPVRSRGCSPCSPACRRFLRRERCLRADPCRIVIAFDHVGKRYRSFTGREVRALDDLTLELRPGEVFGRPARTARERRR